MNDIIQTIAVYALPVIFAITLHEAAHGYVARLFGDPTAYQAGRISLNPRATSTRWARCWCRWRSSWRQAAGQRACFRLGQARAGRFRAPAPAKQDMLWVALAGPAANMLMAVLWALALRLFLESGMQESFWFEMGVAGVNVNLVLMALNLLPLPPLDGDGSFSACSPTGWPGNIRKSSPTG